MVADQAYLIKEYDENGIPETRFQVRWRSPQSRAVGIALDSNDLMESPFQRQTSSLRPEHWQKWSSGTRKRMKMSPLLAGSKDTGKIDGILAAPRVKLKVQTQNQTVLN